VLRIRERKMRLDFDDFRNLQGKIANRSRSVEDRVTDAPPE
jgi:hypothetical protein